MACGSASRKPVVFTACAGISLAEVLGASAAGAAVGSGNLSSYFYLNLLGIFVDNEVDDVMNTGLEKELAFIEERHAVHYYLDERHTVFHALRHENGRVGRRAILTGNYALAFATGGLRRDTGSKVDCGRGDGVVDIDGSLVRKLAFEILALDEANRNLAHNVAELEADRICRRRNTTRRGIEKVGSLVIAKGIGSCGTLVEADFKGEVGD